MEVTELDENSISVTSGDNRATYKVSGNDPLRYVDTNDPNNSILFNTNNGGEVEGLHFNYGSQRFEAIKE
jgi:hypothetical protein